MWNFHSWLQKRNILHSFSICDNQPIIRGVRFAHTQSSPEAGYALLTEMPLDAAYRCMLTYDDNYIYFRNYSVFQALDELDYMLSIYRHWEQALKRLNLIHCELHALLSVSYELIPIPLAVFREGRLLAVSQRFSQAINVFCSRCQNAPLHSLCSLVPENAAEDRLPPDGSPILVNSGLHSGRQLMIGTLRLSGQPIRVVALSDGQPISVGDVHPMRTLMEAVQCNLLLWHKRIVPGAAAYFLSLLQGDSVHGKAAAILQQLHWQNDHRYTVFWLEKRTGADSILLDKLYYNLNRRFAGAVILQYQNAVILLCNIDLMPTCPTAHDFAALLPENRFCIGQSNIGTDFDLISQLMRQAQTTMEHARQQHTFFLSAQSVMLDYMHHALYNNAMLQSLVHPAVYYLMEQDIQHHSHLTDTLRVYLSHGGNCNAAAKSLHLHRNSLVSRLEHIRTIANVNLEDPYEQESLLLSLLIVNPAWISVMEE